ncbi:MAG: hypothetical protein Q8N88_06405, partial [Nanoarchaeota archaeon]|nr:hypothetical protein [Nanoarchaeota archaeon]
EVKTRESIEEDLKVALPSLPIQEPIGKESIMDSREKFSSVPKIEKKAVPLPKTIKEEIPEIIFVRIDKFQSAKKSVDQVKKKIEEMESIIEKLNQVKVREEEEIKGWSTEVANLKLKLSEIDSSIFSQI